MEHRLSLDNAGLKAISVHSGTRIGSSLCDRSMCACGCRFQLRLLPILFVEILSGLTLVKKSRTANSNITTCAHWKAATKSHGRQNCVKTSRKNMVSRLGGNANEDESWEVRGVAHSVPFMCLWSMSRPCGSGRNSIVSTWTFCCTPTPDVCTMIIRQ